MIQSPADPSRQYRTSPKFVRRGLLLLGLAVLVALGVFAVRVLVARVNAKHAMGTMRSIGLALEAYRAAKGSYPPVPSRQPASVLRPYLVPAFIDRISDPYVPSQAFLVVTTDDHYEVWSLGEDGKDGPNLENGPSHSIDADILLSDGEFLRYPAARVWW